MDLVQNQKKDGFIFTMVPKELVALNSTVITLLKYNFRGYNLAILPTALFRRNLDLDGKLVVKKSRLFGPTDKTLKGESKEGWRHVEMEADTTFMANLERYPESHRFSLGSDSIQIWGGKRKPEPQGRGKKTTPSTGQHSAVKQNGQGTSGAPGGQSNHNTTGGGARPRVTGTNKVP